MTSPPASSLDGLTVLERGWLSSNNVLLHGAPGQGATLVDSGHCTHAAQTVALVQRSLAGEPLERIVNTHLHSDHCGGNAALQAAFPGLPADVPAGEFDAARRWDEDALSYRATRQRCERFAVRGRIEAGTSLRVGARRWEVVAAPGHDPQALMLFDAAHGVLISADALWENGFGVVFPELDGESAFDDVAAVLDAIARLPVALVIPGHGAPFTDVSGALARARSRLASWRAAPDKHARHAARVLLKYHLMEEREQSLADLQAWAAAAPLLQRLHERIGRAEAAGPGAWGLRLAGELVAAGALRADGERIHDA
ncbi:MBL fold metallo-hydrolase [uncultured Methylibium sp.]|uniref:MBL fold metallo-hydrolase n=1 Tax=uncultured Methylibium sp. TaxID=381093 RepID=UPI0025F53F14|nr:MBL fold metallo-hydrolase [uncultured Methylibium sp.]